jgi:hypothetical protein
MLFTVWTGRRHRPTRDLDLTSHGNESAEELAAVFREIAELPVEPDGLEFDAEGIAISNIREDQEYHGKRVITFPTLLDSPTPHIKAYPPEAVIAEKLQAMVTLGIRNSRMKDFYDILIMSREFSFDSGCLAAAIAATFKRRNTPLPSSKPFAFTDEFGTDTDLR